ncbi:AAA family ATPase, partial [Xenorhabdus bovienii]|uniref:AAA family ATPase n=1 Tax=Xenorhabdus bovienii TaxID=40576 RepID=UPI0023B26C40
AVIEGLALRIVANETPSPLQNVQLWLLDIGMLQAGAGVRGEFESRLRKVIDEVQSSPIPIILFIDEIHTLIGAGGQQGTGDAANLLKPALARGQLRTLGATTWSEYKKYIEKDPALTRRFQVVQIHEPDEEKALLMLRSLVNSLEEHHHVFLLDEAVKTAV